MASNGETMEPKRPSRAHAIRLYVLLVGLPALFTAATIVYGMKLHPAPQNAAVSAQASEVATIGNLPSIALLLAQLGIIVAAARAAGALLRRLGQPQVIGEMAAGIMLGPSLLGAVAPQISDAIFPAASLGYLNALSQVGVILFMFVVGLQLDPDLLHVHRRAAVITSHTSITTPLLLGAALAIPLYSELAGERVGFAQFALFLGAAMSVTAFPVLARILADQKLLETRLGTIAITCAAVDDASAWCILAAVAGLVRTSSGAHPFWLTVAGALIFVGLALTVGRRIAARLLFGYQKHGKLTSGMISAIILAALAGAWTTEWLGLHALFGAFVVGFIIPRDQALLRELLGRFEEILVVLLLPLFFAFTGLRTHIGLISGTQAWLVCGAIILVAIAGKLGGSAIASRLSGLSWRESTAVGVLMNTRGLVELVFLNVGLELGVISPKLFSMMVIMALVTTAMTTPLLRWVWGTQIRSGNKT